MRRIALKIGLLLKDIKILLFIIVQRESYTQHLKGMLKGNSSNVLSLK